MEVPSFQLQCPISVLTVYDHHTGASPEPCPQTKIAHVKDISQIPLTTESCYKSPILDNSTTYSSPSSSTLCSCNKSTLLCLVWIVQWPQTGIGSKVCMSSDKQCCWVGAAVAAAESMKYECQLQVSSTAIEREWRHTQLYTNRNERGVSIYLLELHLLLFQQLNQIFLPLEVTIIEDLNWLMQNACSVDSQSRKFFR
jgi:hypothetical protein